MVFNRIGTFIHIIARFRTKILTKMSEICCKVEAISTVHSCVLPADARFLNTNHSAFCIVIVVKFQTILLMLERISLQFRPYYFYCAAKSLVTVVNHGYAWGS